MQFCKFKHRQNSYLFAYKVNYKLLQKKKGLTHLLCETKSVDYIIIMDLVL